MTVTLAKALNLGALVLLMIAAILAFVTTDVDLTHIVGFVAAGLACLAAAAVAA